MAAKPEADDRPILLHEFLHAFHFDKLPSGPKNPEILTFYQRAKSGEFYAKDAYVLKNQGEFFAITASAFLHGSIARPPYSRDALRRIQPAYYRYLEGLFGFKPS
jgi:hypothetical protein